ncbi:hypothetical protein B0T20DRAFT_351789, partial [Sordaria brevicollis]
NDLANVQHAMAPVVQQKVNVEDHDNQDGEGEVPIPIPIHPTIPQDVAAVATMSRAQLFAALEALSDDSIPAEATQADLGIVEAIIAAAVLYVHFQHARCGHKDAITGEHCTSHA